VVLCQQTVAQPQCFQTVSGPGCVASVAAACPTLGRCPSAVDACPSAPGGCDWTVVTDWRTPVVQPGGGFNPGGGFTPQGGFTPPGGFNRGGGGFGG
jgi:hypothetical protein